ncbi:MAG TPA: Uma2 family endonuclease [Bryobacteraceae bacterium]|nr:Uma2 family endonuclease [Bryobacteraceae bacterium]
MSTKTLITAAELEQMPDDDSVRIELDEGELITMPLAAGDHGHLETKIILLLGNFVVRHRLGRVYTGDTGFRLNPTTVRAPDVAFVRADRVADVQGRGFVSGAPDLAVEIFSPSDSVRQLMRKVKQYHAAGCHTVWVVYPEQREVNVLEASGADRLLKADDVIEAPELLPGFSARVGEFFGD